MKLWIRLKRIAETFAPLLLLALFCLPFVAFADTGDNVVLPPPNSGSLWYSLPLELAIKYGLPLVGLAIVAALGKVSLWLHSKDKAGTSWHYLGLAGDLVLSIVRELEVTLRPTLGNAAADGKLTQAEIDQLRKAAIDKFFAIAPDAVKKAGIGALGDAGFGTWVSGQIEAAHSKIDVEAAASVDPHAGP